MRRKNTLNILVQNITATEWKNGAYANIFETWLDVSPVSDTQAFELVASWHLSLVGYINQIILLLAEPNLYLKIFYGCNLTNLADCPKNSANTQHMFGNLFLLSDRRGYTFGYGLQWKGTSTITSQLVCIKCLDEI